MSHINFDFLTESFLFGSGIEDKFNMVSDSELERELNRYREYVISNMGEIRREVIYDSKKIAVTIESFSERPGEELLKQLALYVDVVIISDPLFELTEKKSNSTKAMAIVGCIFMAIPIIYRSWINYFVIPIAQLVIVIVLVGKKDKKS